MYKKYYLVGLKPVIREIYSDYENFLVYQWDTGFFKQDISYMEKIWNDISGDSEEKNESDFFDYVEKLRKKIDE